MEAKFERHPLSVPGDFYVVRGECIACGVPEAVAPDLMAHTQDDGHYHCYWKKQPETPVELERAFAVFDDQEAGCHRYAGDDPEIQSRVGLENCDVYEGRIRGISTSWGRPREAWDDGVSEGNILVRMWKRFFP